MLDAADLACLLGLLLIGIGLYFLFPEVFPFLLISVGVVLFIRGAYYVYKSRRPNRWVG